MRPTPCKLIMEFPVFSWLLFRAATSGSSAAMLKHDSSTSGGIAYLQKVIEISEVDDGTFLVKTTDSTDTESLLPHGSISMGWNHTKVFTYCHELDEFRNRLQQNHS